MSATRRLLVVVLLSTVMLTGPVAGQPTVATELPDDENQPFAVTQGEECYDVTPIGNAWENVSSFYGYSSDSRNSEATAEFQENQVSNLLIFHGTEGYSLVLLHDKQDDYGNASYGSTATMEFVGLPESGEWVVKDDNYNNSDDRWIEKEGRSKVNWYWIGGRNDGGAFRDIDTESLDLTITPRFNERAEGWNDWEWSGDSTNRTETWQLYTDRQTTQKLDMNQPIRVTHGECGTEPAPEDLSVSAMNLSVGEEVTIDATRLTDEQAIEYQWDFDGDGTADQSTTEPSVTHEYEQPGEYEVTVEATMNDTSTETASVLLTVTEDGPATDGDPGTTQTPSENETPTSSSDGPGFGLIVGVLALVLSLGVLWKRGDRA